MAGAHPKVMERLMQGCISLWEAQTNATVIDGARLGFGLAAEGNDVTLKDIARIADVFYIGGTKVGALFRVSL
jgi:threonine aldolase